MESIIDYMDDNDNISEIDSSPIVPAMKQHKSYDKIDKITQLKLKL